MPVRETQSRWIDFRWQVAPAFNSPSPTWTREIPLYKTIYMLHCRCSPGPSTDVDAPIAVHYNTTAMWRTCRHIPVLQGPGKVLGHRIDLIIGLAMRKCCDFLEKCRGPF